MLKSHGHEYRSDMQKICFTYKEVESPRHMQVYHDIKVECVGEDGDVRWLENNGGGDCTLCTGIAYIGLDFNIESRRVGGISDFLGELSGCESKRIESPHKFKDVILYVNGGKNFQHGCGYNFEMPKELYYDKESHILQFGECDGSKKYLRFLKNAYAQLDEDGHMKGFLVTDITE